MGTGVPLLNDYKQDFFSKRFPQTVLGGLKLRLGYDAPFYVYLNQILLFLSPFFLGGIFTLLVELLVLEQSIAVYAYGTSVFLFVFLTQMSSTIIKYQDKDDNEIEIVQKKRNLLAEEDEVDFMSCLGVETFQFVIPAKKFKVNVLLHSLLSGVMCGLGLWYLLPTTLNKLYLNETSATVMVFMFGWFAILVAQYSLTVSSPPEPATYRALDMYEITPLTRPVYIFICLVFDLLNRFVSDDFLVANQVLHIVLVCLPVLWTLGVLPPVDALLLLLCEQVHVFLLGGSPVASDLALIILLFLSLVVFVAVYFTPVSLHAVLVAAALGYLLSLNVTGLGLQIFHSLKKKNKVSSSQRFGMSVTSSDGGKHSFLWSWSMSSFLYHLLVLTLVCTEAGIVNSHSDRIDSNVWNILGYVIIGLCLTEKLLRSIQNVYVLFGLVRNPLFPLNMDRRKLFEEKKKVLKVFGLVRRSVVNWVGPFVMLAYLCLIVTSARPSQDPLGTTLNPAVFIFYICGVVRAFRVIWQSSTHSLLEFSVIHIVLVLNRDPTTYSRQMLPLLCLAVGLARERVLQFLHKLYFCVLVLITSWTDKKQRRSSAAVLIFLSMLFFPVIIVIVCVATVISAPLMPLFTLPLFFISFPRPVKFWPGSVGGSSSVCPDTVFYKQFVPQLAQVLRTVFADGSLGEATPGNHYLVRYQDRLVWVMVLERGACYCTVSIKGLELQETSCHTTEAARLDDIFETAFTRETKSRRAIFNKYPLHTLTPVDASYVFTYSDARNVLTGVIDNPDSFKITMGSFLKSLVWLILHHVNSVKKKERNKNNIPVKEKLKDITSSVEKDSSHAEKHEMTEINHNHASNAFSNRQTISPVEECRAISSRSNNKKTNSSWVSLESFTDSIFSDDDNVFTKKKLKPALSGDGAFPRHSKIQMSEPVTRTKITSLDGDDDDIDHLFEGILGVPLQDISKPKYSSQPKLTHSKSRGSKLTTGTIYKPVTNLADSPDFKSPFSSYISVPRKWRELPIEYSQFSKYLDIFPHDWYQHVLSLLDWSETGQSDDQVISEVLMDDTLTNCYAQLTMACYSIFDLQAPFRSASHLYKYYTGDIPWNAMADWVSEDRELHSLVIKAFRYGFKMMVDQMLLGRCLRWMSSENVWRSTTETGISARRVTLPGQVPFSPPNPTSSPSDTTLYRALM
ncbi:hypothetical protein ScPMuIL_013520 [Solemya velum]